MRIHEMPRKLLLAGAVALLGLGALVYVGVTTARGRRAMSGGALGTPTIPEPPPVAPIEKDPAAIAAQPESVARAVVAQILESGVADAGQAASLGDATRAALGMYLEGSVVAYQRWLEAEGLTPPAGWEDYLGKFGDATSRSFELLRGAVIDTSAVIVRRFSLRDDRDAEGVDAAASMTGASRPDRAVPEALMDSTLAIEVVAPAQVRARRYSTESGAATLGGVVLADARLGLVMVWDEARAEWTLIETRIYDLPPGAVAVMPPL